MFEKLLAHRTSIASIAIRMASVAAGFVIMLFISRSWGPSANGVYALVTQTAMFLSVIAVGGLDLAVVRDFSRAIVAKRPIALASFLRVIGYAGGFAAIIIGILLAGGNVTMRWMVGAQLPAIALGVLCTLILARAMTRVLSAVLRSQRQYVLGQVVEVLVIPVLVIGAIAAGWRASIDQVLIATAVAGAVAAVIGIMASLRHTRTRGDVETVPMRPMLKAALPLWGVAIALNVADWYGLATVASVLGVHEAGLYRVAMQVGTVFAIISSGLFGVYSAQISAAHIAGDPQRVARLTRTATRLSIAFVIPPAIILLGFAGPLLALIGPEFAAAKSMLIVIVIGQILYTVLGPAGITLAMTGHERVNLVITLISTASLLLVAPFAASQFGAIGVAAWISFILVARALASLIIVQRLTGINVLTGSYQSSTSRD